MPERDRIGAALQPAPPQPAPLSARLHVVVMAGGSGTRFWPASRRDRPKQLLTLLDSETLLAATVRRVSTICPADRVWIVTAARLVEASRAAVPEVPAAQVVGEPIARNTAPCLGLAAALVAARDPDAVLLVLPADHHIADADAFCAALLTAARSCDDGALCTLGVLPSYPETGYGYIEAGAARTDGSREVVRFVEKPDLATASGYLASGRYLWNAGVFIGRADAFRAAIAADLPALDAALAPLEAALRENPDANVAPALSAMFEAAPAISVDHGLLERHHTLRVVPLQAGWSDVGSWRSLLDLREASARADAAAMGSGATAARAAGDGAAGYSRGDVLAEDCDGCVLVSEGPLVAAIGLRDVAVVATRDAVLVLPLERSQDVRRIVDRLSAAGRDELL